MRLLNTAALEICDFTNDETPTPKYAILSHTWGKEETSFEEFQMSTAKNSSGHQKIVNCCQIAASEGLQYVWIDTCCINKASDAELSEAINSMYRWYHEPEVCYALLADFSTCTSEASEQARSMDAMQSRFFRESRWYSRGWTLQELLAPREFVFHDCAWKRIGSRCDLQEEVSLATGIKKEHLRSPRSASLAQRMSWASRRRTTRLEDTAYCLMGIFDLKMPLIYGEGSQAFIRLQQEILKRSTDESIFAWKDTSLILGGMLALSPAAFEHSGDIIPANIAHLDRPDPYTMTNRGFAIDLHVQSHVKFARPSTTSVFPLKCFRLGYSKDFVVAIFLVGGDWNNKRRYDPHEIYVTSVQKYKASRIQKAYISPCYTPTSNSTNSGRDPKATFKILPSVGLFRSAQAFVPSPAVIQWDQQRSANITLQGGQSLAAIMFENRQGQRFAVLVGSLGLVPAIEILVLSHRQRFDEALAPYRKPNVLLDHARQQHDVLLSARSPVVVVFLTDFLEAGRSHSRVIIRPPDTIGPTDPEPYSMDELSPCCCQ